MGDTKRRVTGSGQSNLPEPTGAPWAIVVVNYRSHALLTRNLARVHAECPDAVVVVVDNFSDAAERACVTELAARSGWHLVAPKTNTGFGGGMNRGVARARELGARTFLLLNPDAIIERPSVDRLRLAVKSDPDLLCAPTIRRFDGSHWFAGADLHLRDGRTSARRNRNEDRHGPVAEWVTGACLMISDDLWQRVGGFADEYFLYWEDVDLSWRVQRSGGKVACLDDAVAHHDAGGTQTTSSARDSRRKSDLYYYWNIRNRLLFAARNLPPADLRRWKRTAVSAAWEIMLRGGRRQLLDRPVPLLLTMARGLRDGLALGTQTAERAPSRAGAP